MKIVYRTVADNYEHLTEMLVNQLEIFNELQTAVNELIALEDFKGNGADSIKAYFTELHGELIRTFQVLVHEIDYTMYDSNCDFETDIDKDYAPIYESEYIKGKADKEREYAEAFATASSTLEAIRATVSHLIGSSFEFDTENVNTHFEESALYAETAKKDFENFDTLHVNDFADADAVIDNILATIQSMHAIGNVQQLVNYQPQSSAAGEWLAGMREYQLKTGEKFEKNGWEVAVGVFQTYSSFRTLTSMIENGYDIGVGTGELWELYQAGLQFSLEQADNGEVLFKITSHFDNVDELHDALKAIGAGHIKHSKLNEMLTTGIKLVDGNGNVVNQYALERLLRSDAGAEVLKHIKQIETFADGNPGVLKIGAKLLDVVDAALIVGMDVYDNVYNSTTGKFEEGVEGKRALDIVTDCSVDLASGIGLSAAGGAIGTLICPGVGTLVGAAIGAFIDIGLSNIKTGEPPKSTLERIKDGIDSATDAAANWLCTVFW